MKRRIRGRSALFTFAVLAIVGSLHAACGGATQSDLFGTAAESDGGLPTLDSAADVALDQTTFPVDAPPDAVVDARPDTPPPVDAKPDTAPPQTLILCSGVSCISGTESCCAEIKNGSFKGECKGIGKCGSRVAVSCDSDDDCQPVKVGSVCCVTFNAGSGYATGASCYDANECVSSKWRMRFCDPNSKVNVCETGDVCRRSENTMPGYYLCLPP